MAQASVIQLFRPVQVHPPPRITITCGVLANKRTKPITGRSSQTRGFKLPDHSTCIGWRYIYSLLYSNSLCCHPASRLGQSYFHKASSLIQTMVTTGSLRGQPAWSPRPGGAFNAGKRYALQLVSQSKSIDHRQNPKRKRAVSCSSSDTEDESTLFCHSSKRICHTDKNSRPDDHENPLGLKLWEESDLEGRSLADELFFAMNHKEGLAVEHARSSQELIQEMDLSDSSGQSTVIGCFRPSLTPPLSRCQPDLSRRRSIRQLLLLFV
jgi:hypothetical protein